MTPAEEFDVAVVGAGPAGSAAAALLASQGYRVAVVDRRSFPREKACAEFMSPGVREVLARTGLDEGLQAADLKRVPGMEIVAPRGDRLRIRYQKNGNQLSAFTIRRDRFDTLLLSQARQRGAEVLERFVAKRALVTRGRVQGVEGVRDGRREIVPAKITVIADGSSSTMARSLGLARKPHWPDRMGLVARYEGKPDFQDGFGQMHVDRGGYCGVAPLPEDLVNVALVVPAHALLSPASATRFFDDWIGRHPAISQLLSGCSRVTPVRGIQPIGSRVMRASIPGAILVGDAAGFFDPFTGEGIYRALHGAELAAEVATEALESRNFGLNVLKRYEQLRASAFSRKTATIVLVQLFIGHPRLLAYALRRLQSRPVPSSTLGLVLGDVAPARDFLRPRMLLATLSP